jgi:predicted DNA-binding transcriptional regulator YafY
MAKQQFVKRYFLIINRLKNKASSFAEIQEYLKIQSLDDEENYEITVRTFQRDINEIQSIFDIEIVYNRSLNQYEIKQEQNESRNIRLMESLEIYYALSIKENLSKHILFEDRKPSGIENFQILLYAIKNNFEIKFWEEQFWEDCEDKINQIVQPLALKEYKYRWYLIAKNSKGKIQRFCLDRISNVEVSNKKFSKTLVVPVEDIYKNSFGIIEGANNPERIVLSFSYEQGKYIKSLPLHHSQKAIVDSIDEYRIELFINITYDFIMELLSFGEEVKVLEPIRLQNEIKRRISKMLSLYDNK